MTNLPQPTVWRLCYTLRQLGYLMQAPGSDKLRIGMAIAGPGQVCHWVPPTSADNCCQVIQIRQADQRRAISGVVDQDDILIVKRAQRRRPAGTT